MPERTIQTKFFTFKQNNSGGRFTHDPQAGIGYRVCVEAQNSADALSRAEQIGLYFNGVDAGIDCRCCGDRWSSFMCDDDGTEKPTNGYGADDDDEDLLEGGWGISAYIHYLDGRVEEVPEKERKP